MGLPASAGARRARPAPAPWGWARPPFPAGTPPPFPWGRAPRPGALPWARPAPRAPRGSPRGGPDEAAAPAPAGGRQPPVLAARLWHELGVRVQAELGCGEHVGLASGGRAGPLAADRALGAVLVVAAVCLHSKAYRRRTDRFPLQCVQMDDELDDPYAEPEVDPGPRRRWLTESELE